MLLFLSIVNREIALLGKWLCHGDIAHNHIGQGLNNLSFGEMPCDPPGTRDGRPVRAETGGLEELLQGHLPLTSLPPLGGCFEIGSHCLPNSDEVWSFLSYSFKIELQNVKPHRGSQEWASQQYWKTVVSVLAFTVCGTGIIGTWHLRLILLFAVYLSNKMSKSGSDSLYLNWPNQSGLALGLAFSHVWTWQALSHSGKDQRKD